MTSQSKKDLTMEQKVALIHVCCVWNMFHYFMAQFVHAQVTKICNQSNSFTTRIVEESQTNKINYEIIW